ncbi:MULTISPECIES: Zn(2+)-responsive transcriptional regulator [unclassified Pseudoalteromonas]|uniref:Zn(2+)-responsive transcriptional regulator n=1 Tax=unclassified Pseudoalteromonas TaxID=194690 RepID=UPI0030154556
MIKIGELAKRLGVSTDTLRYYEANQLLQPQSRSASGYRLYDEQSEKQMRFILRAKEVGFSLKEIQDLLKIQFQKQQHSCEEVKALTIAKRDQVRARIAELTKFEQSLSTLAQQCCGGEEPAVSCSILTALEALDE